MYGLVTNQRTCIVIRNKGGKIKVKKKGKLLVSKSGYDFTFLYVLKSIFLRLISVHKKLNEILRQIFTVAC